MDKGWAPRKSRTNEIKMMMEIIFRILIRDKKPILYIAYVTIFSSLRFMLPIF